MPYVERFGAVIPGIEFDEFEGSRRPVTFGVNKGFMAVVNPFPTAPLRAAQSNKFLKGVLISLILLGESRP